MLQNLQGLLVPAVIERLVLVINHVLAAEPAATARLVVHTGRTIELELQNWPSLLPALPRLQMRITPAGLDTTVRSRLSLARSTAACAVCTAERAAWAVARPGLSWSRMAQSARCCR